MRFLSLFSGIEAASVAWLPLGWTCAGVAEIEPFPCAVLQHHYSEVPNLGDVTKITREQVEALGSLDLVCGGFPCQDLSMAGKRKGMTNADGSATRSGLFFDAMRIAEWADSRWLFIENVPGMFSSNKGRDFAAVVGAMAGCEFDVPPDGWQSSGVAVGPLGLVEWTVLDAQYHGLAQRRRRVFLVRDSGDWASRPPLFLESYRLQGHPAPRRKTGKVAPTDVGPSLVASGRGVERTGETRGQDPVVAVAHVETMPTLRAGASNGGAGHGARSGDSKDELIVPVVYTLPINDMATRRGVERTGETRGQDPVVAVGVTIHGTDKTASVASYTDVAGALRARPPGGIENSSTTVVLQPVEPLCIATVQASAAIGADLAPTLMSNYEAPYIVRLMENDVRPCKFCGYPFDHDKLGKYGCPNCEGQGVAHSLRGEGFDASEDGTGRGTPLVPVVIAFDGQQITSAANRTRAEAVDAGYVIPVLTIPINDMATRHAGTDGSGNHAGKGHGLGIGGAADPMFTLTKGDKHAMAIIFYTTQITSATNQSNPKPGDPCHTLAKGAHAPAIAFQERGRAEGPELDIGGDIAYALTAPKDGGRAQERNILTPTMQVRRLTPRECERLQGFPDNYTNVPHRGKPAADGNRYKAIGNSWATPVAKWIGERIQLVEAITAQQREAA